MLDYNLGGEEDGFDWLKQFKQKAGFPPTIILTAEGDEYIAVKAIKLGAADYINKIDITPKRLADVIKDATEFASESKTKQQEEINSATHLIEKMHKKESDVLPDEGLALGYKLFAR